LHIDILIPVPVANRDLAIEAIESVAGNTDIPSRYVVILDGGVRGDYAELEAFLAGFGQPWKLLHNTQPVYLNQTLREGLEECTAKMTAIVAPQVRLTDPKWFGKAQMIFQRDPVVGIVDTSPNTSSSTLHPVRRAHNNPASPGCGFAIVQTAFARKTPVYGLADPVHQWSRTVMSQGGSAWAAPGIRYHIVEHQEHALWREHWALPNRSE
jgi:hypothetical protein